MSGHTASQTYDDFVAVAVLVVCATSKIAGLCTLAIRVTRDMADAVNQVAASQGKSAAGVVREALAVHIRSQHMTVIKLLQQVSGRSAHSREKEEVTEDDH